jgi:hypothetical protein
MLSYVDDEAKDIRSEGHGGQEKDHVCDKISGRFHGRSDASRSEATQGLANPRADKNA